MKSMQRGEVYVLRKTDEGRIFIFPKVVRHDDEASLQERVVIEQGASGRLSRVRLNHLPSSLQEKVRVLQASTEVTLVNDKHGHEAFRFESLVEVPLDEVVQYQMITLELA